MNESWVIWLYGVRKEQPNADGLASQPLLSSQDQRKESKERKGRGAGLTGHTANQRRRRGTKFRQTIQQRSNTDRAYDSKKSSSHQVHPFLKHSAHRWTPHWPAARPDTAARATASNKTLLPAIAVLS